MWQENFHVWGGVFVVNVMLLVSQYTHPKLLGQVISSRVNLLFVDLPLMAGHIQQALSKGATTKLEKDFWQGHVVMGKGEWL